MEFPFEKKTTLQNTPKIVFLLLLTIIPLYYIHLTQFLWNGFLLSSPSPSSPLDDIDNYNSTSIIKLASSSSSSSPSSPKSLSPSPLPPSLFNGNNNSTAAIARSDNKCNIFKGEWVRNPNAPYYTNTTCFAISDRQNCLKYGRPDTDFLKWRWKPNGCDLPIFNPAHFLELVRGKSMAFVGDSVARNQMQSLICLLSTVEYPKDHSYTPDDKFKNLLYNSYNFTLASFWSPYLVRTEEADPTVNQPAGLTNLYLDKFDKKWTAEIEQFDYVIISAGHWFFHPLILYEGGHIVGCHSCSQKNINDRTTSYGYRKALRTAFRAIIGHDRSDRMVFLRTFSPAHYENGVWNKGGKCGWTKPLKSHETRLEGSNKGLYMAQLKEFKIAKKKWRKRGLKFRLIDTTKAMLMRPDGHPDQYGHPIDDHAYHDCVHWCLPGPIDAWNDFLLQMMKMDGG
ncbi:protein trichome birefringence-like 19 [Magnolia sinica]|uniref:protein trichome birefringence-like 19 n=1 Tax=Magnolia sinica TaxID=86752 RepID=UPI0026587EBE|nr:protein trichome birefringence-like 19 [Magnolia sinica]